MSSELETLDQLLGGDQPLSLVRRLFETDERFIGAISAMLQDGDVRMLASEGGEVPRWQWRQMLSAVWPQAEKGEPLLSITQKGVRRIG